MNYEFEPTLTSQGQSRYAEGMVGEPGGQDTAAENLAKAASQTGKQLQEVSEKFSQGAETISEASKTMKKLGQQLYQMAENGETEEGETAEAGNITPENYAQTIAEQDGRNKTSRERFHEIARGVTKTNDITIVVKHAEEVAASARVIEQFLETPGNTELKEQFKNQGLKEQAEKVLQTIQEAKKLPPGEIKNPMGSPRVQAVLAQAGEVARLAEMVAPYYERVQIEPEQFDPYRNIRSFEELMTWFTISLGGSRDETKFQPGEDFQLMEVEEYTDMFGREMKEEQAHPENFLRWVREKMEFYHDFDPMQAIDLFKNIYIVAGYHRPNLYEMTVDFSTYFAHRVPTLGDLKIGASALNRALANKTLIDYKPTNEETGEGTGTYVEYDKTDPNNPKIIRKINVKFVKNPNARKNSEVLQVIDLATNEPIKAVLEDRQDWQTVQDDGFNEIKEQILYELWLQTYNHNMDVNYRQKGMPSEKQLNETMAELYSVNIWTRTRSRLPKMFNMASTTRRSEDGDTEAVEQMNKSLGNQGSVGKSFQRSLAAYYHIAEANATANGYTIDGGKNPFKELLKNKEGINGSDIFYKSVISQGLERDFEYKYEEREPQKSKIAAEFLHELNNTKIQRTSGKNAGSFRDRRDWEKADLYDLLFLDKGSFLREMSGRGITQGDFDRVYNALKEKYGQGNTVNSQKLSELEVLVNGSQKDKREAVFNPLKKDRRFKEDDFAEGEKKNGKWEKKPGYVRAFIDGDDVEPLDKLAVDLFKLSFPSEFTPDLNPFVNISYSLEGRDRVRQAMRDTLVHTEKLDKFEALYAEEWAYTMVYYTGIAARNDMLGIGHDAWSKVLNTEYYRLRQTSGGNYPGNLDNLYGIHRLGVDMWEGLKVQLDGHKDYDTTMYEILTGLDKDGNMNINQDMPSYEFYGNAMRQFYADHINHALELFVDLTQKHEFNFDKIVAEDQMGRVTINHAEMQKMIDSTWKHLRYAYDNRAFLYDSKAYGWWQDESINEKGQVVRKNHFGLKSLRDLMFSHEIVEMGMYNRKDVSGWAADQKKTKMARNVFAYLIKAQLEEHTKRKGEATLYNADQISLICDAFMNYAARVIEGKHGEALVLSGFFNKDEIFKILVLAHAVLWKQYLKEYKNDFSGGFLAMIIAMMQIMTKEIGSSITLASK